MTPYYHDAYTTIYHADCRALLRQLCPDLTPAMALEWIRADSAFEQDVLNEAAILLGGEWTTNDHKENTQ